MLPLNLYIKVARELNDVHYSEYERELPRPFIGDALHHRYVRINFKSSAQAEINRCKLCVLSGDGMYGLWAVADTGIRQWGGGRLYGGAAYFGAHALLPPPPPTVPLPSMSHWVWNSGARHKLTFHASMQAIHNLIIF